ncbi:hypothetical protein TNCV_1887771 [Trichonephila clavipes]|nr:hypothetical protein TNCV_1887771 [Trichonephila clavipes]
MDYKSKLRKEIKFGWQSKASRKKRKRKEFLMENEKEAEKTYRCRKYSASNNFGKEIIDDAIDNLSSDKENWMPPA